MHIFRETRPILFYSPDGVNAVTFIQYHKLEEPQDAGIYMVYGINKTGKPSKNFVFVNYTHFAFFLRWENDKLYIRAPGFTVKENTLLDNVKIDFSIEFTEDEKKKYGYYTDRDNFIFNVQKDFIVLNADYLPKIWD